MTANESKNLSEKQKQQIVCEYARKLRTNKPKLQDEKYFEVGFIQLELKKQCQM